MKKLLLFAFLLISFFAKGQVPLREQPIYWDFVNGAVFSDTVNKVQFKYLTSNEDSLVLIMHKGSDTVTAITFSEFKQLSGGLTPDDIEVLNKVRLDSARWDDGYENIANNAALLKFNYIGGSPVTDPVISDTNVREIGNVIKNDTAYIFTYTYHKTPSPGPSNTFIKLAYSEDGISWNIREDSIISRSLEDPYLVFHNDTYYLYAEDKQVDPFHAIRLYTSTDLSSWNDQGVVLDTSGIAWEETDVSSPTVYVDETGWTMLYEGRDGTYGAVGLATSPDGINWTKHVDNPIIDSSILPWAPAVQVPDNIIKVGDIYYLSGHARDELPSTFRTYFATSTNLTDWADYFGTNIQNEKGFTHVGDGVSVFWNEKFKEYTALYADDANKNIFFGRLTDNATGNFDNKKIETTDTVSASVGVFDNAKVNTEIITTSDGNSSNWKTAYDYSQIGHLPLTGGTLTGNLFITGNTAPRLFIRDNDGTDSTASAWVEFRQMDNLRIGWMGYGAVSHPHFEIANEVTGGDILVSPNRNFRWGNEIVATRPWVYSVLDTTGFSPSDSAVIAKVVQDSSRWDSSYLFSENVRIPRTNEFQYICVDGQQPSTPQPLDSSIHFSEGSMITIGDTIYHFFKQAVIGHITNVDSRVVLRKRNVKSKDWTQIRVLYDSVGIDDRNVSAGYVDGKFTVWFRRYNANTGDQIDAGYIYSDDGTQTWSDYHPYDFQRFVEADYLFYAPYGGFFTIGDSTYQGWYAVYSNADSCRSFWTSTVDGENWFETNKGETYRTLRANEYWTEPYWNSFGGSDTVIALVRNQDGTLGKFQSLSFDGGLTWSALELTNLQRGKNGLTGPMLYYDQDRDWLFSIVVSRPPNGVQSTIERDSIYVQVVKKDSVIAGAKNWNLISVMPIIFQSRLNSYGYTQMAPTDDGYLAVYVERTTRGYISNPSSRADSNEIAYIYEFDINLDSNQLRSCPTNLTNANQTYNQYTGNYEFRPDYFDAGFQTPPTASEVQMDPQRVLALTQNTFTDKVMWCTNRNGILQWYIDYRGNFVRGNDTLGNIDVDEFVTISGTDTITGQKTFFQPIKYIGSDSRSIVTRGAALNIISFENGSGTEVGYIGDGSSAPEDMHLRSVVGNVILRALGNVKVDISDFEIPSTSWFYIGAETTDGSFRVGLNSGNYVIQERIGGVWTEKFSTATNPSTDMDLQQVMDNGASYDGTNKIDITTTDSLTLKAANVKNVATSDYNILGGSTVSVLAGQDNVSPGSGAGGLIINQSQDRMLLSPINNNGTDMILANFATIDFLNGEYTFNPSNSQLNLSTNEVGDTFDFVTTQDAWNFNKPVVAPNIYNIVSADSPLDFPATPPDSASDINIVVPGAEVGDQVLPVIFPTSIPANSSYKAWVSGVNQVTIRFINNSATVTADPPEDLFTINVMKISN